MASLENDEQKMLLIICGIPFAALIYCAIVIGSLLAFPAVKSHAFFFGGLFALIPLVTGAALWIGPFRR